MLFRSAKVTVKGKTFVFTEENKKILKYGSGLCGHFFNVCKIISLNWTPTWTIMIEYFKKGAWKFLFFIRISLKYMEKTVLWEKNKMTLWKQLLTRKYTLYSGRKCLEIWHKHILNFEEILKLKEKLKFETWIKKNHKIKIFTKWKITFFYFFNFSCSFC